MLVLAFIIVFFAGIYGLSLVLNKWNNPYKLIFLFGKKGSGKSTLLVRYMTEYHKKGYSVYTTMDECTLPYVSHIKAEDIGFYVAKPKSLVTVDEVGTIYDARKFKTFKDEVRDYYKFQRHYKNVVIMASQSWDVDKKIRDLTDKFYLCGKLGPVSYAREIVRSITITEPVGDSESRIADQLKFKPFGMKLTWIPKYAKHFLSFNPPERPYFVDPPLIPEMTKKQIRSARKERRQQRRVAARRRIFVGKPLRARFFHKDS